MRKLLGSLALAVIVFALVGLFRGWLSISTNGEAEKARIEVTIDKQQLKDDAARLKNSVQNLSGGGTSGAASEPPSSSESPSEVNASQQVLPPEL